MSDFLYSDGLVTIDETGITFHGYSFPLGRDKRVELSEIGKVAVRRPTLWSGRWRIHGTGDFRTWFPGDSGRPGRDRIFVAHRTGRWWRIGFTVEDSDGVIALLRHRIPMEFEPGTEPESSPEPN
ncbi:hypothetical protein [Salidesulfovibrio onnuriiensis]|uniref:hypothetical protein n=1 Tax=Salidesulfovibrio onnuriiensis TaxID=2583823 RepID=UPI00165095F2|nr:hypothetical protein [Salidesulfovibrio onnuriiensis]